MENYPIEETIRRKSEVRKNKLPVNKTKYIKTVEKSLNSSTPSQITSVASATATVTATATAASNKYTVQGKASTASKLKVTRKT